MNFKIDSEEVFPVFSLYSTDDSWAKSLDEEIELTDKEYNDFCRVKEEWYTWQERLKEAYGWDND